MDIGGPCLIDYAAGTDYTVQAEGQLAWTPNSAPPVTGYRLHGTITLTDDLP